MPPTPAPEDIPLHRLYCDLSGLMGVFSPPEDYAEEAAHWRHVLRERLGPGRHRALELGAGGGHCLSHLTDMVKAVATDLSPAMLRQCRRLNPGVPVVAGDMRTLRLAATFDAVLIHDAIAYLTSEDDIRRTLATAAAHLRPGGVLILAPDHYAETFTPPVTAHECHTHDGTTVAYFEYTYDPDPTDHTISSLLTCVIQTAAGVRIEHDRHLTGLFAQRHWLDLLRAGGFTASVETFALAGLDSPYTLLIGVRG